MKGGGKQGEWSCNVVKQMVSKFKSQMKRKLRTKC